MTTANSSLQKMISHLKFKIINDYIIITICILVHTYYTDIVNGLSRL